MSARSSLALGAAPHLRYSPSVKRPCISMALMSCSTTRGIFSPSFSRDSSGAPNTLALDGFCQQEGKHLIVTKLKLHDLDSKFDAKIPTPNRDFSAAGSFFPVLFLLFFLHLSPDFMQSVEYMAFPLLSFSKSVNNLCLTIRFCRFPSLLTICA